MTDILPCPFCGGEAHLYYSENEYIVSVRVECNNCMSHGPTVNLKSYDNYINKERRIPFEQEAINVWNVRTNKETKKEVRKKVYCDCCGKQVVWGMNPKIDDQYITKGEGSRAGFGGNVICGYCSKDLDENGLFPEERG